MASLLLWVQWHAPIDDAIWNRLAARAGARCRHRIVERSGPGYRLLARAARAAEPDPLVERSLPEGRRELLLLDRANGPEDDDRASSSVTWDEQRLLDGTPTAAVALALPGLEVTLTRDLMGQRALVYAIVPGGLLVASGEDVLLAHPAVSADPDPLYLAANFACLRWGQDETAFRAIRAVAPGEVVRFSSTGMSRRRVLLEPDESWRGLDDAALVDRFRELLHGAVDRACRGARRVGISLSAGLDSTSVAALAARASTRPATSVVSVTQGLSGYPEIDERALAAPFAAALGHEHVDFAADALLPYSDPDLRPVCPDVPHQTPFREWKEASYRTFAARDVDVVLTGNFGDFLFTGWIDWACDALRYGRWRQLASGVVHAARQDGVLAQRHNPGLRRIASRALGRTSRLPDRLRLLRPPYRDAIEERLRTERAAYRRFSRPQQAELIMGSHAAFDACGEDWFAQRHGVDFRSPFRDLALNRWCLSVPADLSVRRGVDKWVLREAMRGLLPEDLRTRPKGSDLTPWQVDAAERQRSAWASLRGAGATVARTYLDPDAAAPLDADEAAVLEWMQIAYGSWLAVRAP